MFKMKQSLLKQKVSTLSKLDKTKKGCDMSFLRGYPDEKIHDICEACFNVLQENIPIKGNKKYQLKKKLKPIKMKSENLQTQRLASKLKGNYFQIHKLVTVYFQLLQL